MQLVLLRDIALRISIFIIIINPFASEAVYTRTFYSTRIPFFESFAGSRVNTPLVAVTNVG